MIRSNWLYIAVMFAVSYTIRILPLTLIRKPIKTSSSSRSCTTSLMSLWRS